MDRPHFDRLARVVEESYLEQRDYRERHKDIMGYMDGSTGGFETSINLLSMAYRGLSRQVISKAPRMLVNTGDPSLKAWSENAELASNKRIRRSNLADELADVGRQSLVSYGVLFMGPTYRGGPDGMALDIELKSINRVDHVYDPDCDRLEDSDIQGHKFRVPVVDVWDNPMFEDSVRRKVDPDGRQHMWGMLDEHSNPRTETRSGNREGLYDYVELWCVYDRRRESVYYFPRHQPDLLLMEFEWHGPAHGLYRYLYYERVPGQPEPIAPLTHLVKKHRAYNLLDMKSIHQQQVAKGLLLYTNASKEEAESIVNAVDNQSVLQENGAVRWSHVGGADQATVAMAEKQRRDFSYAAGNLDQFLGLASQADTLGQERLLSGSASAALDEMSSIAQRFVKGVCEDVFWWDVRDPDPNPVMLSKSIPGTDMSYGMYWTREHRTAVRDMEFDVDVEPYSYVDRTPGARLADLLGALQIAMGMGDMMIAQGISLDVEAVIRTVAKYRNLPELYDWFILNQSPEELSQLLGGRGGQTNPMDAGSPHRYIRESRSDGTAKDVELMRMFGGGQGAEREVAV